MQVIETILIEARLSWCSSISSYQPGSLLKFNSELLTRVSRLLSLIVKVRNCLILASTYVHSRLLVRFVLLIVLIFRVVVFTLFVFVLCLVCTILLMSLDCSCCFPSVFSNVCLEIRSN